MFVLSPLDVYWLGYNEQIKLAYIIFIPQHMIVAGYYVIHCTIQCPSVVHPSISLSALCFRITPPTVFMGSS